ELESAVCCLDGTFYNAFYQAFRTAAIMNEVGNSANPELMLCRKLDQVGETRHASVFIQYFADDGGGGESRQMRQIATGFCVAGAHEHAAVLRHERKNMPRLDEVIRFCIPIHGNLYRTSTVGGGNAGGH